jgi:hypothetical protein
MCGLYTKMRSDNDLAESAYLFACLSSEPIRQISVKFVIADLH